MPKDANEIVTELVAMVDGAKIEDEGLTTFRCNEIDSYLSNLRAEGKSDLEILDILSTKNDSGRTFVDVLLERPDFKPEILDYFLEKSGIKGFENLLDGAKILDSRSKAMLQAYVQPEVKERISKGTAALHHRLSIILERKEFETDPSAYLLKQHKAGELFLSTAISNFSKAFHKDLPGDLMKIKRANGTQFVLTLDSLKDLTAQDLPSLTNNLEVMNAIQKSNPNLNYDYGLIVSAVGKAMELGLSEQQRTSLTELSTRCSAHPLKTNNKFYDLYHSICLKRDNAQKILPQFKETVAAAITSFITEPDAKSDMEAVQGISQAERKFNLVRMALNDYSEILNPELKKHLGSFLRKYDHRIEKTFFQKMSDVFESIQENLGIESSRKKAHAAITTALTGIGVDSRILDQRTVSHVTRGKVSQHAEAAAAAPATAVTTETALDATQAASPALPEKPAPAPASPLHSITAGTEANTTPKTAIKRTYRSRFADRGAASDIAVSATAAKDTYVAKVETSRTAGSKSGVAR